MLFRSKSGRIKFIIRFLVINEPHEIKLAASPKIALSSCCRGAGRAQSIPEKIKLFLCLFSVSCVIFQKEFSFLPCVLSRCSHVQLFLTLWSIALQAPLAMGFSKQECWSGLPYPPPWDLYFITNFKKLLTSQDNFFPGRFFLKQRRIRAPLNRTIVAPHCVTTEKRLND